VHYKLVEHFAKYTLRFEIFYQAPNNIYWSTDKIFQIPKKFRQ